MKTKAMIEVDLPVSCSCCMLSFFHTGYDDDDKNGCGYLQADVTEYADCRHPDCPLKTLEYAGYEDHIRIGNESDGLRLLEEMVGQCKMQPRADYNDMEMGMFKLVEIYHSYFLPRLEAVKDALERNII
jgi:hypothetical protein